MKISKYNIIKEIDNKILIYNSFTKASLFLEKDSNTKMFEDIKEFEKLGEDEKKILIHNGFVIEDNRDEFSELKYIYEQRYFATDYFNIILVPSLSCNFGCPYCCEKDYNCGKDNIKKYFSILKKYAKNNFKLHTKVQISLFGGEPLLFAKDCLDFLHWVKEDSEKNSYEYFTTIVTNGSLLTKEILEKLAKYNLYSLQITIDSDKENHDRMRTFKDGKASFDLLINKINMVAKESVKYDKFKFVMRINLNNTTVDKVRKTLLCVDEKQRKNVHLLIRTIYNTHAYKEENTNSVNELKEYFDLGAKLGFNILKEKYNYQTCESCGDRKMFYLMPDLSLWKCINDIGYDKCKIGFLNSNGVNYLIV